MRAPNAQMMTLTSVPKDTFSLNDATTTAESASIDGSRTKHVDESIEFATTLVTFLLGRAEQAVTSVPSADAFAHA